ncbi:hypothetical protein GGTG_10122 [Gaeumannomyces tritici R3-111a-1]|uniref:STB6-like N-terminal domain-containing protein n=1 Tax=Gaeumannomyces tritici (strain R3-111a-1) TaxID=644352 RepID=J3P9E0_GAET3|nr:hypothetical protein GGTG_10122 [Gaeumannomyces tritici R3-111a-1]EJT73276.1 hypothetical protein GGTG_10122 [Gaeumannomyces tritici R3-111a-1]
MSFWFSTPPNSNPRSPPHSHHPRDDEGSAAQRQPPADPHRDPRHATHNDATTPATAAWSPAPGSALSAASVASDPTKPPERPSERHSDSSTSGRNLGATPRRHVVFPDPVAFRYLEEEPAVSVVERRAVLTGYELYLVEQWACSRRSPTLVIVTYTGDPKHSVVVGVMSIPADERDWSPRLRMYFRAIHDYHARPKETSLGELMVTNLSSFPSALTVIPVPDGDIRKHREVFIVNEDLKRMGCSGRSGMTLSDPTAATQAKFLQLYKTSDRIPFFQAVLELVKLCQAALFIFGKIEQEYVDGLLCDVTETAVNNWWTEIGSEYFNIEPSDGILGPTTVAALLGTLMGARKRLSWYGAPVGKDVFDIESTKRGINYFQKSFKLERTRRLDRQTLLKLHSVTAKAATGEGGWGVQRAVKSTVAEIGGKRGEMVIGMVSGGRDKGNMADIETLDLDRFISLTHGERAKWLWHGKPKRPTQDHADRDMGNGLFGGGRDDASTPTTATPGGAQTGKRVRTMPADDELTLRTKEESATAETTQSAPGPSSAGVATGGPAENSPNEKDALRKTVFKRVGGKVSDARSGLGRIRDAVGGSRRGHQARPSRDEAADAGYTSPSIASLAQSATSLSSPAMVGRAFTWKNKPEEYSSALRNSQQPPSNAGSVPDSRRSEEPHEDGPATGPAAAPPPERDGNHAGGVPMNESSVGGSIAGESEVYLVARQQHLAAFARPDEAPPSWLQRRHSLALASVSLDDRSLNDARWPRRLSFSVAEDVVLRWEEILEFLEEAPAASGSGDDVRTAVPAANGEKRPALVVSKGGAEAARALLAQVTALRQSTEPWAARQVDSVEALDGELGRQRDELGDLYDQLREAYELVSRQSTELLTEERARATEAVRDVEGLAQRLEYEVNSLASKVADVEDGVGEFERQVEAVEARADELKIQLETESWMHWAVRTVTGIGTGPNILTVAQARAQRPSPTD